MYSSYPIITREESNVYDGWLDYTKAPEVIKIRLAKEQNLWQFLHIIDSDDEIMYLPQQVDNTLLLKTLWISLLTIMAVGTPVGVFCAEQYGKESMNVSAPSSFEPNKCDALVEKRGFLSQVFQH